MRWNSASNWRRCVSINARLLCWGDYPLGLAKQLSAFLGLDYVFSVSAFSPPKVVSGTSAGLVREYCSECHSVDYIITQPPQTRLGWTGTVDKMSNVFGMPALSSSDEDKLLTYLETNYGMR